MIGRERFREDRTYVVVANHQSLVDILVLFRLFRHFRWVSKVENFRIPLVGQVMRMNRYIEIDRGKADSVRRMLRACEEALREGNSVLIFPEGTRSETGELRPFKIGAFELARSSRCPILPVVVDGTARALPKRGIVLQGRCEIRVEVLDEIPPDDFKDLTLGGARCARARPDRRGARPLSKAEQARSSEDPWSRAFRASAAS